MNDTVVNASIPIRSVSPMPGPFNPCWINEIAFDDDCWIVPNVAYDHSNHGSKVTVAVTPASRIHGHVRARATANHRNSGTVKNTESVRANINSPARKPNHGAVRSVPLPSLAQASTVNN